MEVDPTFAPGPFPERLMFMLQKESNQNPPVVSFCSNGCTFKVHNKDQFLAEIMPKYFKQTKFMSFQRQQLVRAWRPEGAGMASKELRQESEVEAWHIPSLR